MEATTLNEIRIQGFRVLVKNLGPADAIRFIQSYTHGSGDYTRERKKSGSKKILMRLWQE